MLKRFTICRSERKEKKGVGRPNIVICLETYILIVLYTFSIRVILTLRCPRRRKKGGVATIVQFGVESGTSVQDNYTYIYVRRNIDFKKGQNCTMRMGRLYRGKTKKEITKVAISRTRKRKKEGGKGAKTRP